MKDRFEEIQIGDEAELFHTITAKDVDVFVDLTGDDNPLHVDDEYASRTTYKNRVVHGMLTASFISTVIGTKLPGTGSLWYEQRTSFLAPVRIGQEIRIWVQVKQKSTAQRIVVLETVIFGDDGRRVIEGTAKVKVVKPEIKAEEVMKNEKKGAIIVSGASGGIGSAIAMALAADGYPVVINYLRDGQSAERVVNEIVSAAGQAIKYQADVSDSLAVQEMVKKALSAFENISGVVNNASGPMQMKDFTDLTWSDMQNHIDIQIKGAFNLSQAALTHLQQGNNGVVLNIASVCVDNPPVKMLPYNLAKAALIAFSNSLAVEYGPQGIRVNCISPGMTLTDLISDIPEKGKMLTKMQTPLRRLAEPDDISGLCAFLFSEKARHITGQNFRVCGGVVTA